MSIAVFSFFIIVYGWIFNKKIILINFSSIYFNLLYSIQKSLRPFNEQWYANKNHKTEVREILLWGLYWSISLLTEKYRVYKFVYVGK